MTEKYILLNDIIENHSQRMDNLKKYYPFFKLQETTFSQYKEGRYNDLDMGYITLASLRFFIDENNFNERRVTYDGYRQFLKELLRRDFELVLEEEEMEQLVLYIFDKLKNEGKPFCFHYFDPKDHKRKMFRIKLIESEIEEGNIFYYITADGVEFYLDTKEIREESKISIQQILLEKMIQANNFKGGIDVVRRMNVEVQKLSLQKREVIELLEVDVYEGEKAYQTYMDGVARWFTQEEKMFSKNKKLIENALRKVEDQVTDTQGREKYFQALEEIYELETELKKTIECHANLIAETMELTKVTDSIIAKAKLKRLRPVFDFQKQMQLLQERDQAQKLQILVAPLLKPNVQKRFSFEALERLLTSRPEDSGMHEKVEEVAVGAEYIYPDEAEEQRLESNFKQFALELLEQIKRKHKISLLELNAVYEIKFGRAIFRNGDYYSFLVHLCQKAEYHIVDLFHKQDTFLDGIIANELNREEKERYEKLCFRLHMQEEEELEVAPHCYVSNIIFERTDI